ncbi:MAG: RNA polymerase sigma factor [Flavobacteriales bacterium]|nr:RNA polymerase sigma factor [Flavobacteriales bacterium]
MPIALTLPQVFEADHDTVLHGAVPQGTGQRAVQLDPRAAQEFVSRSDAALIKRCLEGDSAACSQLFKRYYGQLMPICMRYARSNDEAKDMMQDGFARIFAKLGTYSGKGHFIGWMKRVILNTAINHYRAAAEDRLNVRLDDITHGPALEADGSGELVTSALGVNELLSLVQELPPAYRMVFNLRVMEGWTHEEIAAELGISVGTSKSNLARARAKLMEQVVERDPSLAAKRKRNAH